MLKPFQIRDLHVSPSPVPEVNSDSPASQGVVQISAADYDDIASNHPRARLTYMDYDDGDQITVGSSLELSERLDEPIDINQRLDSIQISQNEPEPMHLFDIRRSNSVTELWKRFENTNEAPKAAEMTSDASTAAETMTSKVKSEDAPALEHTDSTTSATEEDSQPLMAAFEAELANILRSTETSDTPAQGPTAESEADASASSSSQRIPPAVEQFMAQMLQQLCSGVGVMQTELRTRIPELRRQLSDAQRDLPENLATSLQALFTQLEAQMRNAFNNLPDNGRHMAEEAIQAGRPVAENAVETLRSFATDLDQSTRTLFAAFENEFSRSGSQNTSTTVSSNAAPGPFSPVPNTMAMSTVPSCQGSPVHPVSAITQQKDTTTSSQSTVQDPEPSNLPRSQSACPNLPTEREHRPWGRHPPRPRGHWHWPSPFHPPPPPHHTNPLAQPPNWVSSNAGQPWHQFSPPPHHFGGFPPPSPPGPDPFAPWFHSPSMPQFFPAHTQQPRPIFSRNRTPAPPPYTATVQPRNGGTQTEAPGNKSLFIGNVGFNVTEKMIRDVFASKGFIVEVDLPLDSMSGKHAGFGYLHFPSIHPAMAAMNALQGFHIDGHAINLEFSDQMPIKRMPASQPSSEAANSSSLDAQQGSSQTGSVSDASAHQRNVSRKEHILPEDAARKNGGVSIKRRKSVTFQGPVLSQQGNSNDDSDAPRAASPALIDLTDEFTAGVPPVCARSHSPPLDGESRMTEKEMIDVGMNRFPPVSQLDAHLRANQRQGRASVPPHGVSPEDYASFRKRAASHRAPEVPPETTTAFGFKIQGTKIPKSVTYGPEKENFEKKNEVEKVRSGGKPLPTIKRSDTVNLRPLYTPTPNDFTAGTPPLRRRATERNSLRPSARQSAEMDTWARLDRRERLRSRPSSTQSIPGSFPVEEVSQPPLTNASPNNARAAQDTCADSIDNCISSLVDMGYGTPEEGGRSRMGVYAAASNGSLLDAIEMIEEERKAYARQRQ